MWRLLREPRWISLGVLVLVALVVFAILANWQYSRHEDRIARNAILERNLSATEARLSAVVGDLNELTDAQAFLPVRTVGQFQPDQQWLVRRKPLNGTMGFWVVNSFRDASGSVILVNRGWVAAPRDARDLPEVTPPPTGEVAILGRLRVAQEATSLEGLPSGMVGSANPAQMLAPGPWVVTGAYLDLVASSPDASNGLTVLPPPDPDPGPHLSYSMQWIAFGVLFIVGLYFLLRREFRYRAEEATTEKTPEHPVTTRN